MAVRGPRRTPTARPGHVAAAPMEGLSRARNAKVSDTGSREPLAHLLAPLPGLLPSLLLPVMLPFWLLASVVAALVGGVMVKPLEAAAGLAAWGAFGWLVLAFLGAV